MGNLMADREVSCVLNCVRNVTFLPKAAISVWVLMTVTACVSYMLALQTATSALRSVLKILP